MKNPILIPELRELLKEGRDQELRDFFASVHPATAAELIGPLEPAEAWRALLQTGPEDRAKIFGHFDLDVQVELARTLTRRDLATIFSHMSADERVDLFNELPEAVQETLVPALAPAEREDLRRLASYEDGTAGSVMTSEYASLSP